MAATGTAARPPTAASASAPCAVRSSDEPPSAASWRRSPTRRGSRSRTRRSALCARSSRRAGSSTSPVRHGWEHSALGLGRVDPVAPGPAAERGEPPAPRAAPGRAAHAVPRGARRAGRRRPRRPGRRPGRRGRRRPPGRARRGPSGVPGLSVGRRRRAWWPSSPHPPITIGEDYQRYPNHVAQAVETLRRAGVGGPYAIALGPRCYTGVIETTEHGGYPVLEHLRLILGGPVVWAPAVDGAVVLSQRGDDFELVVGPGPVDRLHRSRCRVGGPLPGGEPHLPGRQPRGGGLAGLRRPAPETPLPPPPDVGRAKLSPHRKGSTPNDVIVSTARAAR